MGASFSTVAAVGRESKKAATGKLSNAERKPGTNLDMSAFAVRHS